MLSYESNIYSINDYYLHLFDSEWRDECIIDFKMMHGFILHVAFIQQVEKNKI